MMAALLFRYTCIKPLRECKTSSDIFYLLYHQKISAFRQNILGNLSVIAVAASFTKLFCHHVEFDMFCEDVCSRYS